MTKNHNNSRHFACDICAYCDYETKQRIELLLMVSTKLRLQVALTEFAHGMQLSTEFSYVGDNITKDVMNLKRQPRVKYYFITQSMYIKLLMGWQIFKKATLNKIK